ncbi:acyltransferase ChoActase/COT/CPT [Fistulina hepatica ATCC 64428]|uniref:Acyltransferase ChoActase/COT/CPT n=1 Tax=Fistulina hepatica ATCC 64428 TaxID=1128425 RepID=A0A0D7AM63_9AGAR|nr:acyltransferase ChoActase/COT/CPT [Fistulina hepatica ATCC 64428]
MSTLSRPANWKAQVAFPRESKTFGAQASLPRLPVPELPETLSRLKETLAPIAWSSDELRTACRKIDNFAQSQGPQLQKRLLERAASTEHWLEEWWDDIAYFGYRDSIVINVSYYYGFSNRKYWGKPVAYAAALARSVMLFRRSLKRGELAPETLKTGPICVDTYRWMFDCCRVPGTEGLDWGVSHANRDQGDDGHIIVIRRNRVWKVPAAHNGHILSTSDFERQLAHIYSVSEGGKYPGVGLLTASDRDSWAQNYNNLRSSPVNAAILDEIESAAFIICLEDARPSSPEEFSRALWHGSTASDGTPVGLENRWCDKPCQFVVFDNGLAGLMGEHSVMDGTPTARLCNDVLDALADPSFDHGVPTHTAPEPAPLDWDVTPALNDATVVAQREAAALVGGQALSMLETPYGKAAIKRFGVSPDAWAQMVVQLAHRRLRGDAPREGGTYEAATTRGFFKGRTEAIRVVSTASDAWAASMDDPAADVPRRKELFAHAAQVHLATASRAARGQGVDRHLLGLKKCLRQGEDVPAMFGDPLYQRACTWVLSTSAIFSPHFSVYGWGEVVPNGFGVAYVTGFDDKLVYTITSRTDMPNARFADEIRRAAIDVFELFDGASAKL